MRTWWVAIAFAALFGTLTLAVAQEGAQKVPPRFSSRAEVVLVPVIARGKDGKAVTDLKPEELVVLDNGKPQPIASFDPPLPAPIAAPPKQAQTSTAEFTNIGMQPPRRLTIIALDPVNTAFGNMVYARDAVTRYLREAIHAEQRVALLSLDYGGFRLIHDFSDDPAVLAAAITRVRLRGSLEPLVSPAELQSSMGPCRGCAAEANAIFDITNSAGGFSSDATAESMRAIARTFGLLPGRKTLIWVTDSFPLKMDLPVLAGPTSSAESGRGTPRAIWEAAFRALNDANIAVYPVHAAGLVAFVKLGGQVGIHNERLDAMTWISSETGGKLYINTNDILHSIELAAADSDAAYNLSFSLPVNARKGWHQLRVKVRRPGVRIVARSGFFAGRPSAAEENKEMEVAVTSPFPYTALPLTVRFTGLQAGTNGKSIVRFQLSVPAAELVIDTADRNHVNLDLRTLARTPEMNSPENSRQSFDARLEPESVAGFERDGFIYDGQLELVPGDYEVRFAARDNLSGRIGTVTAPLHVEKK